MASSSPMPIQSILKIEDLTSEEDALAPKDNFAHGITIDDDDDEEYPNDDGDEEMLSTHNTSKNNTEVREIPSTSGGHVSQNLMPSEPSTPHRNDQCNVFRDITHIPQSSSENRESKVYVKTKPPQFQAMIAYMIANPDFSKGFDKTPGSRTRSINMWAELTAILNKEGPPSRGVEGWKKVWSDHKAHIRTKLRKNKLYYSEPRVYPNKVCPLSRLEERVADLCGYNEIAGDVTSTLNSAQNDTQSPSTDVNSCTVDEFTNQSADQSDDLNTEHNADNSNNVPLKSYSPPLSRKCKRALLQTQIDTQRTYTIQSKKLLNEINYNLKGLLQYSIKSFELEQKRFALEKEKFEFEKNMAAQKHQIELENLQLQRDILRLKQETAGF